MRNKNLASKADLDYIWHEHARLHRGIQPQNLMTTKQRDSALRIKSLSKALGLSFRNPKHISDAFTHASVPNLPAHVTSPYERLEFFGDAILNFAICEKLYRMFPDADEGDLSRMRSTLVSKKLLVRIAQKLGLGRYILTGTSDDKQILRHPKILADTLEALIGAIYLDRGLGVSREFVWKYWNDYFDERKIARFDPNPKSTLQELVQKIFRVLPNYETSATSKGFAASVSVGNKLCGKGKGLSKKEAEEKAALILLKKLKTTKRYSRF